MQLVDLSELKEFIPPSTKVYFSQHLTSKVKDYRQKIRTTLFDTIKSSEHFSSKDDLLDLTKLPSHPLFNISISHCPKASGFALIDKNSLIGLDIEDVQRPNDKLIQRISSAREIKETPFPQRLLSAKESAWKAVHQRHSITTISQIETLSWKQATQNWSSYKISFNGQSLNGNGFISEQSGIYISFYISDSTFA